jgi:hypothetical protein
MSKKEKLEPVKREPFRTMLLPVILTHDEILFLGPKLAGLHRDIDSQRLAKKESMGAHDGCIKAIEREIASISQILA